MGHGCHDCGFPNSCECPGWGNNPCEHGTIGCKGKGEKHACTISIPGATSSRGIVSTPGSAIEILSKDRDVWKNRALEAERRLALYERKLAQLYVDGVGVK